MTEKLGLDCVNDGGRGGGRTPRLSINQLKRENVNSTGGAQSTQQCIDGGGRKKEKRTRTQHPNPTSEKYLRIG